MRRRRDGEGEDRRDDARARAPSRRSPSPLTAPAPSAAKAAPTTPPMSACDELDGRPEVPRREVPGDRADEAGEDDGRGHRRRSRRCPWPTVAATCERDERARRSSGPPTSPTAKRGDIARVEIDVAIALAVSWKPLVKSKRERRGHDDDEDDVAVHGRRRAPPTPVRRS